MDPLRVTVPDPDELVIESPPPPLIAPARVIAFPFESIVPTIPPPSKVALLMVNEDAPACNVLLPEKVRAFVPRALLLPTVRRPPATVTPPVILLLLFRATDPLLTERLERFRTLLTVREPVPTIERAPAVRLPPPRATVPIALVTVIDPATMPLVVTVTEPPPLNVTLSLA